MMTKIHAGDILTCLNWNGTDYWHLGLVKPQSPYWLNGTQVTNVKVEVYDVTGDDELNPIAPVITDANAKIYAPGPRPRNIFRR